MNNETRDQLITETHEMLATHIAVCEACRKNVTNLQTDLYGTPDTPGIKTRVLTMQTLDGERERRWSHWKTLVVAMAGAAVTVIANRLLAQVW